MNYKTLTNQELDTLFKGVNFYTKPMKHQLATVAWAMDKDRVVCLHGIGTGKTKTALDLAWIWGMEKILVVCPNTVINSWIEQIQLHAPQFIFKVLKGSGKERYYQMQHDTSNIHITNYEGLKNILGQKKTVENKFTGETKNKFVADWDIEIPYDCFIADEIHRFKDARTVQTKIGRIISAKCQKTIMLTGTPIGNSEMDLWGEYLVLDNGNTLGKSFTMFAREFCTPGRWGGYEFNKSKREKLLERVEPVTLRYAREECCDLPSRTYQIRNFDLLDEQYKMQEEILDDIEIDLGNGKKLNAPNILVKIQKLAQITGGFVYNESLPNYFKGNPKLDALEEILQEINGNKTIIFHHYVEEGSMIANLFKKFGIKYVRVMGGQDNNTAIDYFKNNTDCQILVAQTQSGGEGLNLQMATIAIFYSNEYSYLRREQAEGRIYRVGQTQPTLFIDLIANNSIDGRIQEVLSKKKDISDTVLDWLKERKNN